MPLGINEWRAGISKCTVLIIKRDECKLPITEMVLQTLGCLAYLYLFMWISVFTAPLSGVVVWLWSHFVPMTSESPSTIYVISHLNSFSLIHLHLLFNYILDTLNSRMDKVHVKTLIFILQNIVYTMLLCICLENLQLESGYSLNLLLLLSGDIHVNPGPNVNKGLKFFHWNLNSICARNGVKISQIEAYDAIHKFDVIAISESMLDGTIRNDAIRIKGFSPEVFRNDHPSNSKTGGVCLYFRDGLPIKRRDDLEVLQEMIVSEVTISRKKIFVINIYRSPSQNSEQFEMFIYNLQQALDNIRNERPHCILFTGDFNCRSSQWLSEDIENPEGTALDDIMETNILHQLIDEPTNIRNESMSCIDLIIADKPNMFADYGAHPSLDIYWQHQVIFWNLNMSLHLPPPYKRTA